MMKRIAVLLGIICISLSGIAKASGGVDVLKNSSLVVVLLEPNQKYEDKLNKQHKQGMVMAYENAIKQYNQYIQDVAGKFLKLSNDISYKTMGEIAGLSASTRAGYSFLVYNRPEQTVNGNKLDFSFDFYADKESAMQTMADAYKDWIDFEAADPKYHGEEDYRFLDIIIKSGKKSDVLFEEGLDMILPTKGSLALCCTELQEQFSNAELGTKKFSKDVAKGMVRDQVAKARSKILLICKDNLDRNMTEAKLKMVYKYKMKVVTRDEFDKAIIDRDTSASFFVVYPAGKAQGGYKPTINYQHLLIDGETGDVLVTVEAPAGAMAGAYQKIADKHLKDLVTAEDDLIK